MWPYLHLPVVVLLITSAASIGFAVGGPPLALTVGGVFSLEPFILAHGPVWDDVVLATALEWTIFAVLISATAKGWLERSAGVRAAILIGILICAGWGAVTRLYSQVLLTSIAVVAITVPRLRILRQLGWAMAVGIVLQGFGFAAANSMQQARLVAAAPELSSATVALNTSSIYVGQALGSALGGFLFEHEHLLAVGYATVVFFGAALAVLALTRRRGGTLAAKG